MVLRPRVEVSLDCFAAKKTFLRARCSIRPQTPMLQNFPETSPFHGLSISSHEPLHTLTATRSLCPDCHKSFKYFCYRCLHVPEVLSLPQVRLPLTLELYMSLGFLDFNHLVLVG